MKVVALYHRKNRNKKLPKCLNQDFKGHHKFKECSNTTTEKCTPTEAYYVEKSERKGNSKFTERNAETSFDSGRFKAKFVGNVSVTVNGD